MKLRGSVFFLAGLLWHHAGLGQPGAASRFPEIRIQVAVDQYERLKDIDGSKLQLSRATLSINGDTAAVKDVHSRGTSSLNFIRKSLSVDLSHGYSFTQNEKEVNIKKFDLLNLAMDKNLWHNRWAFQVLHKMGLFPLFNTFCTLWINDDPQGIYLLVEKPNHASERMKSPYMVRRAPYHKIKHEYVNTNSKEEVHQYRSKYHELYRDLTKLNNEELLNHLQSRINLEQYFYWLGFNYLIMNGDYTDELYFYIEPESKRFEIIPWDYDDLFARAPHEGNESRHSALNDKLIFSLEDALDRAIASDEKLYASYCSSFKTLLTIANDDFLDQFLNATLEELEAISTDSASVRASRYHDKEAFDINRARDDIRLSRVFMINRRNSILKSLGQ